MWILIPCAWMSQHDGIRSAWESFQVPEPRPHIILVRMSIRGEDGVDHRLPIERKAEA